MGLTLVEKMLSGRTDPHAFKPGDIVLVRPDLIVGHDLTVPYAINVFNQLGVGKVKDPDMLVFVQDHFQPARDARSASLAGSMREFARQQGVEKHYDIGRGGICHVLILEKGLVKPGMLVAGADSHTMTCGAVGAMGCGVGSTDLAALWALGEFWLEVPSTRKIVLTGTPARFVGGKDISLEILRILGQEGAIGQALEYTGSAFAHLTVGDRITISNMAAETGATTCIIQPDKSVLEWVASHAHGPVVDIIADPDAVYARVDEIDVSSLGPLVAVPDSPANVVPVDEVSEVKVDQVFLGGCTNGYIEDLRRFAAVFGGREFSRDTRVLVSPATQDTYSAALAEGILARIVDAGGMVQAPSCGPCIGGHSGVLGAGEVCLSTTNRNFKGRMGHPDSKVYLAGPEIAAATAVTGRITNPCEVAE